MLVHLKNLIKKSSIYGLGDFLVKGIAFFLIPLYTQYLTPEDYGVLAAATTYGSVLTILLELGIGGAIARFYFDYKSDQGGLRKYLGTVFLFLLGSTLVITLILDSTGERLFSILFRDIPFHPFGRIVTWTSFFTVASLLPQNLFRVKEQPAAYISITVTRFLVMTGAIIYFVVFLRQGSIGSLRGQLFSAALFGLIFVVITFRNIDLAFHLEGLKRTLAFSFPLIPHQLSGWALAVSDRILLERFVSHGDLGLYNLGYRFATLLDMLLTSFNFAWAPFFFRIASTEDNAKTTIARMTTYFSMVMICIGLGVALFAKDVIAIIAKPGFHLAYTIVPPVVLAFVFHGFYFMVVNQLFYAKKTRRLPVFTMISAGINIGLNLITLNRFGITAAAWNTLIGYLILFLLVYRESRNVYPLPYEFRRLAQLLAIGGLVFLAGYWIDLQNPWINLVVKSGVISLFPISLFVLRFFTKREVQGVRMLLQRMKHGLSGF